MEKKLFLLVLLSIFFASSSAWATVSGQCSNCHTMHNSQNGINDKTGVLSDGTLLTGTSRSLTKGDCVGCHTGDISASATDKIPYIMSTGGTEYGPDYTPVTGALENAPATNTLAGGSFNGVRLAGSDNLGHNVFNIRELKDANMPDYAPPGWIATTFKADAGGGDATGTIATDGWTTQLTCAGTMGCHGNHVEADDFADINGAHHGDDSRIDGSTVAKSYRFLRGILGYEDADWELSVSSTDHNTYYGLDRANTTTTGMDAKTISYLCAECHGNFHSGTDIIYNSTTIADANPWLRHPTDFSLQTTAADTEYRDYANASGTLYATGTSAYNYIAPLASANVSAGDDNNKKASTTTPPTGAISDPFAVADNDIVTCLSCHRAHGSAYADLLRWDYTDMQAGSGGDGVNKFANKGCFACHTTKD